MLYSHVRQEMVTAADRGEDRLSISCCCFCIGRRLSPLEKRRHRINENRSVIKKRCPSARSLSYPCDYISVHCAPLKTCGKVCLLAGKTTSAVLHLIFLSISLSLKGIRTSQNNQCCTSAFELFTRSTQGLSNLPILAGLQWKLWLK